MHPTRRNPLMMFLFFQATLVLAILVFASSAMACHHKDSSEMIEKKASMPAQTNTIVDVAVQDGQFNTLAKALMAADLVDTLSSEGPFTVFAPTDAAFAKLPEGTVENLLKPENIDQLKAILTYHVVAGEVKANQVVKLSKAETVNGQTAKINVSESGVKIDDANVVKTDIDASNGVIHVIDQVILPK